MRSSRKQAFALLVVLTTGATGAMGTVGCRGNKSSEPPVHLNPNMDFQQRFEMQERNDFFADHRAMRPPVDGTVARTRELQPDDIYLEADSVYYQGRGPDGRLVDALPRQVTLSRGLLQRGQDRFDIHCAPCHAAAGTGDGLILQRGFTLRPRSYHDPNVRAMPLAYFFDVATRGRLTMRSYAAQVPVADRWAIAAYIRVLQASQSATLADLPPEVAKEHGWGSR